MGRGSQVSDRIFKEHSNSVKARGIRSITGHSCEENAEKMIRAYFPAISKCKTRQKRHTRQGGVGHSARETLDWAKDDFENLNEH